MSLWNILLLWSLCRREYEWRTYLQHFNHVSSVCVCVYVGCVGAPAEERRIWGAQCQFRRKGAAVDLGLRPGQVGPDWCLCFGTTAGSPQQLHWLQGESHKKKKKINPWTDEKMRLRLLLLHLMNDCPGTIQDHSLLTLHAYKWKVFWWHMTVNAGTLSKWYCKEQNFKIKKYSSMAMSFCLSTQVDCLAPSSGQYLTLLSSILVANTC